MKAWKIITILSVIIILLMSRMHKGNKDTIVYGSMKCGWTRKQLEYNNEKGLSHVFVDCDKRKCPPFVKGFPTIQTKDGKIHPGFTKL